MWGQLSTASRNLLKWPNGEILIEVDHNQLRTMASETLDPIDWSHPPTLMGSTPERLVYSINRCSSNTARIRSCNLQQARQPLRLYAASQGKNHVKSTILHARQIFFKQCIVYIINNRLMHFNFKICIFFYFSNFFNKKNLSNDQKVTIVFF